MQTADNTESVKDPSEATLEARINRIFVDSFELDASVLTPGTRLYEDLGLDSLDAVDMVIAFQKKLSVRPEKEEVMSLRTLGDVYALAHKYQAQMPPDKLSNKL